MRLLIQRVLKAQVDVNGKAVGSINQGLLVFIGTTHADQSKEIKYLTDKLLNLRIFSDDEGKMNLSVQDVEGEILIVSQFTLYGDTRKGRRPSFVQAASPDKAEVLYDEFVTSVKSNYPKVETGIFQADMKISLVNDGPVTFFVEA